MKGRNVDVRIFISYAHRDPPLFRQLLESLLRWSGVEVTVWTDEHVTAGSVPDQQIRVALGQMHIFVALISPLFDASEYIQQVEVPIAKERWEKGKVLVAPIVVSHPGGTRCKWLLSLEHLPHKQKSWSEIRRECRASEGEYDQALQPLRDGIWTLVQEVRKC
jgi:hypothetical protein